MTKKLYDEDAYLKKFSAKVISCEKYPAATEAAETFKYDVVLDQTLFFPEEGGQTPDKGTLGGYPVVDVQIKNEVIIHTISVPVDEEAPMKAGDEVAGEIDWPHRCSNMQQHTGEHIFSGLVHKNFGYDNVGFHLSDSIVTMDYNGPLTEDDVRDLEWETNRVIMQQIPVSASYPDDEKLAALDYRCKKELKGAIRIVTIPGVDDCACCAPHVKNTGEVGLFKVLDFQSYKGGVRLSILCGFRALLDYRIVRTHLRDISHITSAPMYEAAEAVTKLKAERDGLKFALGEANRRMLSVQISQIAADVVSPMIFTDGVDTAAVRSAVNEMVASHDGYCGIFNGNDDAGYSFIIGSRDLDCNDLARFFREKFSAKCGGKPEMIQGHIDAKRAVIENYIISK
ncbi:MAG: alanyl-tRNA editing protein [Lachnospiraceae bacterium]|nr:alanyl-tRNA editing protein [Lachnospiraceae bacterium]